MAERKVKSCDVCSSEEHVDTWQVSRAGGGTAKSKRLDLCGQHGEPLAGLLEVELPSERRQIRHQVTTIAEIQAMKRAAARSGKPQAPH